jgi:hypothetical protein
MRVSLVAAHAAGQEVLMAAPTGTDTRSTKDEAVAAASDVKDEATGQARAVAHDAKAGATSVAETAKSQARDVTGQLQDQARTVLGDASTELEHQLDDRLRRMTGTARERTTQLQALADGRVDDAGVAADWARSAADHLGQLAERVESLGPRGVAEEAANFARRRPMAFLAGAAAAGFLVGRLVRNANQSQSQNGGGNGSQPGGMPYAEPVPALPAEGMATAPTGAAPVGSAIAPGPTGV